MKPYISLLQLIHLVIQQLVFLKWFNINFTFDYALIFKYLSRFSVYFIKMSQLIVGRSPIYKSIQIFYRKANINILKILFNCIQSKVLLITHCDSHQQLLFIKSEIFSSSHLLNGSEQLSVIKYKISLYISTLLATKALIRKFIFMV